MEDTSTRKKHTGEPGNGGHFGSKQNEEDDTTLAESAATPAADRLNQLQDISVNVARLVRNTAEATIIETAGKYPDATTGVFSWVDDFDGSSLSFDHLEDKDGNEIDLDGDDEDVFSDAARIFDDFDTVRKASGFNATDDTNDTFALGLKGVPDSGYSDSYVGSIMGAEWAMKEATQMSEFADKQIAAAGVLGVKAVAVKSFPDAKTVIFVDGNDGPGSPYLVVSKVLDTSGNTVWDYDDGQDDLADDFGNYAAAIDRDMSLVTKDTPGVWTLKL
jgi:hypothetical protein